MRNIFTLIKREFIVRITGKAFIISTLITPIFMAGIIFVPGYLMKMKTEDQYRLLVSDPADLAYEEMVKSLQDTLKSGINQFVFSRNDSLSHITDKVKADLEEERITAFVYIAPAIMDSGEVVVYAKNVSDYDLMRAVKQTVNDVVLKKRIGRYGLDPALINTLTKRIGVKTIKVRKGKVSESSFGSEFFISYIFVLILYMTILIYGQMIGRGVLEDKQNRVVEILLSSAKPQQLMAGKLIGIGAVGLAQYLVWAVAGAGLLLFGMAFIPPEIMKGINLEPEVFIYFVVFFILGYFLYSSIYLMIASMVNSDEEFQQTSMPVIFLVVIPILLMGVIVKDPNSQLAVITSMIPFFTPMLMMMRVTITSPGFIEVAGSIVLLLVTIWGMMWLSGKIFRTGILMYGKKPNLPEILKWIKYK